MRIRKLLLVHPGRSIRALIQKYIYAELSDIEISAAADANEALNQVGHGGFDIIIVSDLFGAMELIEFKSQMEKIPNIDQIPLLVITDSESEHAHDEWLRKGFEHVAQLRVRPYDLIKSINALCDPRQWRKDARYHIPDVKVTVVSPEHSIKASLINISRGGLLVELTTDNPSLLMNGGLSLTLQLPTACIEAEINNLGVKLLRVETVSWSLRHVPSTMRATFIFEGLKPASQNQLEELIQMAKEDKLDATEVID